MKIKEILKAGLAILICQSAGILGSYFTIASIEGWYSTLIKPPFNPPSWVFGPVWTLLYTMMGISLYLIYKEGIHKKDTKAAVILFGIHLFFNAIWSILFFGLKNPLLGFVEIILLLTTLIIIIGIFYKIRKAAGLLLIPYLLWLSFATILNFAIWQLNY